MVYDYIIVGAGIAGLNAARLLPQDKKVLVLCKKSPWECNTFYAQGGIASAVDENDIPDHIQDTLNAGVNHNKKEAVELLSRKSKACIDDMIKAGLQFDLNSEGKLAFTKEAAHCRSRILHADGDATGRMMHHFLLTQLHHELQTEAVVNDLLIENGVCYGVKYYISQHEEKVAYAHNTILASGGIGSIYKYHTNSTAIAGEIQGLCVEKGLSLKDMEMMQFHPTVLKGTSFARKTLLTEALRGEGATVVDDEGKRFLFDYHEDGELAPRDVVSRAIFDYAQRTNKGVYLSFEAFSKKGFKQRFPNIYANLHDLGYELPFERVPISPAFHYAMGGIETTLDARVKGFDNLFAIGEVAYTGVHGANRLASNSLLEGVVFSQIAVETALKQNYRINKAKYSLPLTFRVRNQEVDKQIKDQLRKIMWDAAAIVREQSRLQEALDKIESFLEEEVGRLLYLRLLTARSILRAALERKTSLGAHFIRPKES